MIHRLLSNQKGILLNSLTKVWQILSEFHGLCEIILVSEIKVADIVLSGVIRINIAQDKAEIAYISES